MNSATSENASRPEKVNVLVVDDTPANLLALRAVLEPLGENVVEAGTGEAALKYLISHDCAAILLDARLPGMSGFEVAEALRRRPRTRDIPILFVTGTLQDSATTGYAHGAFDYILKPYNPDAMRAKVSAIVKLYRQRRHAEQQRDALAASERHARAEMASERANMYELLAQAPALVARLRGPSHVFEFANARYVEVIGNRNPVGKPFRAALPELDEQPFYGLLDSVYQTGEPFFANEARAMLARGPGGALEESFFNFSFQPTRAASGAVDGILVHAVEVTAQVRDRVAVEQLTSNLRQSEARFRGMAEAIPQQVWTARADGTVDFVNSKVTEYAGKTIDQVLKDGWAAQIHSDDRAAFTQAWARAVESGAPLELELRLHRAADGVDRWHLLRALAERDERGALLRWYGTLTDIHEQKEAVDQLARANALQQRLLAVVGHDLRNPLNAITVTAQLLRKKAEPTLEPLVLRIARSAGRMTSMIGDIVDFTRARLSGGMELVRQPCSLRELCREVIDELALVHPDRHLELLADDPAEGEWDGLRLQQAVSNLVANGLQHSPRGTAVVVRVEAFPEVVAVSVRNEGAAIPADVILRVFEPFKRREQQPPQGTHLGLGLYIVAEVVRSHGGSVDVQSDDAAGTCVTLRLPRR